MNQLLHQHTESIVSAAIHAVLPDVAVVRALQGYRFGTGKIVLVAEGKAAWQMANAASDCLGDRIADGVVVTKESAYVNVKVAIEKMVTRNIAIKTSDIKLNNKQSDYRYELVIKENSVAIKVMSSAVSKITAKSFHLAIDASELSYGENTITLDIPDGSSYTVQGSCTVTVKVTSSGQ